MASRSWTEIDLDAYALNLSELRAFLHSNQALMQIVKADAYGHGAWEISRRAEQEGVAWLGVANAEEGAVLRYRGIELPILVLSPSLIDEIGLLRDYNLVPTLSDLDFARAWSSACGDNPGVAHVNLDTGMGRSGVAPENAHDFLNILHELPGLVVDGVFSHYSASECDDDFSRQQLARFERLVRSLPQRPRWVHIANSPAAVTQPDHLTNLVRLGLLSYGIYPDDSLRQRINLRPVMTFKTTVSMVRRVSRGASIGYNRTYTATRDHSYAILPVGYADGYDFLLSGKGVVLLHDRLCPVLGKVSMDMTTIGLDDDMSVKPGDEATVLGAGHEELRAEKLAARYGGNPYELLCQLGRRARRYYRQDGRVVASTPLARREFHAPDFSDDGLDRVIEASISQRLQSKEIAALLYDKLLKYFFADHDRDIHYRRDFRHTLTFSDDPSQPDHWLTRTKLEFHKRLQAGRFVVACATNPAMLERYFTRRDCEYRWLLDDKLTLDSRWFEVTGVQVNDLELDIESRLVNGCIEIGCSHPSMESLVGEEVSFRIDTRTYYPRRSHQLSVFITEPTQGVDVSFHCPPESISQVQVVPVFAGRTRFPHIKSTPGCHTVSTDPDEWVLPNSGIVFTY
ncbi:MAG: alanine racemase [Candidatus Cloacimonetes bacterium]|nr:alanine racemase [Candidatus Cloacimonadota bacterium]